MDVFFLVWRDDGGGQPSLLEACKLTLFQSFYLIDSISMIQVITVFQTVSDTFLINRVMEQLELEQTFRLFRYHFPWMSYH